MNDVRKREKSMYKIIPIVHLLITESRVSFLRKQDTLTINIMFYYYSDSFIYRTNKEMMTHLWHMQGIAADLNYS